MSDFFLLEHDKGKPFQYLATRRNKRTPTGTCVIHTAENVIDLIGEDSGAEGVAAYIARRTDYGSYHFLCDSDSLIFMAPANYETWHDTATNNFSYGGSMAVRAGEWHKIPPERRERIVKNCAAGFASYAEWLKATYGITIPAKRITRAEAHAGKPGFLGHGDSDPGRRSDPGVAFDWPLFLAEFERLTSDTPEPEPELTPLEELLQMELTDKVTNLKGVALEKFGNTHTVGDLLGYAALGHFTAATARNSIASQLSGLQAPTPDEVANAIPEDIAAAVASLLAARLDGKA